MADPKKTDDPGHAPTAMERARNDVPPEQRSTLQRRSSPPPSAAEEPPTWFANRYRVEQRLGRGGMAEVYRVYDTAGQRVLALKRLLQNENIEFAAHVVQLFEHEFHTLSQLVHPRIVTAYDYYRDASGPYYTMELLDGGDLRELAPLPWRQAAKLLCDVCSGLSLLHSRQLLHRDLTPLNIRCTRDGHAKLFDFGSMTRTGVSRHIVGTPPFIAPEALAGQALDPRTDLFALGATAYFTLSGRHAYPARTLASLHEAWQHAPQRLSVLAPDIPPDLEDLVHSLLALEPTHRPASAAVVLERLSALAGLTVDDGLQVQQAYLSTPTLVGRGDMLLRAQKHLSRAAGGRGGALVIHGAPGVGRSRFLAACALDARLSGALVLRADAHDASAGKWAGARALLRQLLAEDPELSERAMPAYRETLAHLLPELGSPSANLQRPEIESDEALAERRVAIQTALRKLLCEVAEQRVVLIAVDDAPRLDEPSAALIALLAHEAQSRRLLVFATAATEEQATSGRAIALLTASSDAVRLRSLTAQETLQLLMSLFGDVPNVRLLADRLHAASSGSPGVIMQLAQQLLERGVVRYGSGAWLLPSSLDVSGWSSDLSDRMLADVRALSPEASGLAQAMALCAVRSLSLDECLSLREHGDAQQLTRELNELLTRGVFARDGARYFFSRSEYEPIVAANAPAASTDLQLRAASVFKLRGDVFRASKHLLAAGDAPSAIEPLIEYLESTRERRVQKPDVLLDSLMSMPKQWPETFQALMDACVRLNRPKREYFILQLNLVAYAAISGVDPGPHRQETIAQLSHDAGLDLYATFAHEPKDTRLHVALAAAIDRFEKTPEHERVLGPIAAIPRLAQSIIQTIAWAVRTLDPDLLAGLPSLAPLGPLSPALVVVQRDVDACLALLRGSADEARSIYLELLTRLDQPDRAGFEGSNYNFVRLALIMGVAELEVVQGMPGVEKWSAELARDPLFSVTACRLQRQDQLMIGNVRRAEELRAEAERLQIQNLLPQLFEGLHLLPQVVAESEAEDLLRVKQTVAEIEEMARQYPKWQPCLHYARGVFQALRGDTSRGLEELERALAMLPAGRHLAWALIAHRTLMLLNRMGRHHEAVERGRAMLASLEHKRMRFQIYTVMSALALAEAAIGDLSSAQSHAEQGINDIEMRGGRGVMLGFAYEMRARVAIYAADALDFATYAQLCEEQYSLGQNPALVARHKRLLRDAADAGLVQVAGDQETAQADLPLATWATLLSSCKGPDERAARALGLIIQQSRSQGGYLFTLQRKGPVLVAHNGVGAPPPQLEQLVASYMMAALDDSSDLDATTVSAPSEFKEAEIARSQTWGGYTPMLLSHVDSDRELAVVGLAVMLSSRSQVHRIPHRLLSTLSKTLLDTGDVPSVTQAGTWRSRFPPAT